MVKTIPGIPRTPLIIAVSGLMENVIPTPDKIRFDISIAATPAIQPSISLNSHLIGLINILHSM